MHVMPILSTLSRHRTAAALIVLEIALTCAIVCNAVFLIGDRLGRMSTPSGVVEDELAVVRIARISTTTDEKAIGNQDLVALREIPGVKSVAVTNMIPFGRSSSNSDASTVPDDPSDEVNVATYQGSPDLLETLGLEIAAGRDFLPEEYVDFDRFRENAPLPSVLVSRAVADRLYPGQNPLGQKLYMGERPQTIVGVFDHLARPNMRGLAQERFAVVLPVDVGYARGGS